mgnify:CR=1 FL=1
MSGQKGEEGEKGEKGDIGTCDLKCRTIDLETSKKDRKIIANIDSAQNNKMIDDVISTEGTSSNHPASEKTGMKKISDFEDTKKIVEPDVIPPHAVDLDVIVPAVEPPIVGSGGVEGSGSTALYSEPFEIPEIPSNIY